MTCDVIVCCFKWLVPTSNFFITCESDKKFIHSFDNHFIHSIINNKRLFEIVLGCCISNCRSKKASNFNIFRPFSMIFFRSMESGMRNLKMRFMLPENQGFVPKINCFDRRRRLLAAFPLDITFLDVKTQ
jgi:hypothetical protein